MAAMITSWQTVWLRGGDALGPYYDAIGTLRQSWDEEEREPISAQQVKGALQRLHVDRGKGVAYWPPEIGETSPSLLFRSWQTS